VATGEIVILVDKMAEFRKDYQYLPEELFLSDLENIALKNYFIEAGLFWNKLRFNKLINGDPDLTSWVDTSAVVDATIMEVEDPEISKKTYQLRAKKAITPKATTTRVDNKAVKAKAPAVKTKSTQKPVVMIDVDCDEVNEFKAVKSKVDLRMSEEDDDEIQQLRMRLQEAKRQEEKSAIKAQLLEDIRASEERVKTQNENVVVKKRDIMESCVTQSLPQPPVPPASSILAPVTTQSTMLQGMNPGGLSHFQMRLIHEQTKRQCMMNEAQLNNVLYENMLFMEVI
jgi:hypothetical protein